jgi:hypothetical protein
LPEPPFWFAIAMVLDTGARLPGIEHVYTSPPDEIGDADPSPYYRIVVLLCRTTTRLLYACAMAGL